MTVDLNTDKKTLPFDKGLPLIGHTFAAIKDPVKWGQEMHGKHGEAFMANAFFQNTAFLQGPDALEWVWADKTESFSAEKAYRNFFGAITDTSLLLKDFTDHRIHRQALNPAFKAAMMKQYVSHMNSAIAARVDKWRNNTSFAFYPAIKQLTLDVATEVFLGQNNAHDRQQVNRALTDLFASALAVIRLPIPGTKYHKAMKAKAYISDLLRCQIASKRTSTADDVFTKLCATKDADGNDAFSEDEIIGHMITFWVAGHDTLASSLSTLVYHLGKNPVWQEKLRSEIASVDANNSSLLLESFNRLTLCGYAFNEALRLMPPGLHTPRVALRDLTYNGFHIPKGITISVGLYGIHNSEDHWPNPTKFDPERFAPENKIVGQHKYAWAPFGGGAHKCIGMIFAQVQAKVFLSHFLAAYQIELDEGYEISMRMLPTPSPADGLPLTLKRI